MSLDDIRAAAKEAHLSRMAYRRALGALREKIVAEDRNRDGQGRNELAEAASEGLSRRLVFEALSAGALLADAQAALAGIPGVRAFTFNGERARLAVEDLDLYESRDQAEQEYSIRLSHFGRSRVRSAVTALARAGLAVADEAPLDSGGNAEITRNVAA